jgi:hypothetical protein
MNPVVGAAVRVSRTRVGDERRMTSPSEPDIQKYASLMKELKLRMEVLEFFASGKGSALYQPPTVESCYLQVRKMLELIAFGSLVANKTLYEGVHARFASHWHAGRLLEDLAEVNPDFYPKPVVEVPSKRPGVVNELQNRPPDFLDTSDFVQLYNECGAIMHARNPYAQPIDYGQYQSKLRPWQRKIMNLLNSHQVHLVGHPGFYLIHMKENQDDEVHFYEFKPPVG